VKSKRVISDSSTKSPRRKHFSSYATACVFEVARKKQPSRKKCFGKIDSSFGTWKFFRKNRKKLWKTLTFVVFREGGWRLFKFEFSRQNSNFPAKIWILHNATRRRASWLTGYHGKSADQSMSSPSRQTSSHGNLHVTITPSDTITT